MAADDPWDVGAHDLIRRDVDIVVTGGAARELQLELERLLAVDRLAAGERHDVPLGPPVDERSFDVALVDTHLAAGLRRHRHGLELALKGGHLPARRAIVGEDAGRPLGGELEAEEAGLLDLAHHQGDAAVARGDPPVSRIERRALSLSAPPRAARCAATILSTVAAPLAPVWTASTLGENTQERQRQEVHHRLGWRFIAAPLSADWPA